MPQIWSPKDKPLPPDGFEKSEHWSSPSERLKAIGLLGMTSVLALSVVVCIGWLAYQFIVWMVL